MVWYQSGLLIDICIVEAQMLDFKNWGSARSEPVMWLIAQFLSFTDPNTPKYLTKL